MRKKKVASTLKKLGKRLRGELTSVKKNMKKTQRRKF